MHNEMIHIGFFDKWHRIEYIRQPSTFRDQVTRFERRKCVCTILSPAIDKFLWRQYAFPKFLSVRECLFVGDHFRCRCNTMCSEILVPVFPCIRCLNQILIFTRISLFNLFVRGTPSGCIMSQSESTMDRNDSESSRSVQRFTGPLSRETRNVPSKCKYCHINDLQIIYRKNHRNKLYPGREAPTKFPVCASERQVDSSSNPIRHLNLDSVADSETSDERLCNSRKWPGQPSA